MSVPCCEELLTLLSPGFFKALGDPNRIAILGTLAGCCSSLTVTEIASCCPVDVSVVSRHLAQLRDAGIVRAEREGKHVRYRVQFAQVAALLRRIADAIEQCCPPEAEGERCCAPPLVSIEEKP